MRPRRLEPGRRQLDAINLLNTRASQITYAYDPLLKTDTLCNPGIGVAPTSVCRNGVMGDCDIDVLWS